MIHKLKVLQIETTNFCNSNCIFCIHSTLKKFGKMSDELFLKILNEAKEIPSIEIIVPMLLGEPFMDKKIISRLLLINRILPGKKIALFTNCSLLTKPIIKKLLQIENLEMFFSLNGAEEATRKKLMGLNDFYHALSMIKFYESMGGKCRVQLVAHHFVSKEEKEVFKSMFINPVIISYKNWSGEKFTALPKTKCNRAIHEMTIMNDGKVNLCCMEYGKVIFGDINKSSVKEIWESKARQEYANNHFNGKYMKGVCSNCTMA